MARFATSLLAITLILSSPAHAGTIAQFQWVVQPQIGTGDAAAHGVTIDHSGNTIFCGTFTDTLNLPTGALRATGNTIPGNTEAFVAKVSPTGTYLWARHGGNSTLGSNEVAYDVAVDPAANVYVTGEYSGASATSFEGIEIDDTGGGAFGAKYDADGTIQWAKSVATNGVGNAIAIAGSGPVYVFVGGFPTSSIKKLDAANGNELASWDFTGLGFDQSQELSVDGTGSVTISGNFTNTVDFDPGVGVSNLVGDANGDGFIARYASTGTLSWARKLASVGADAVLSHVLDGAGDVYFTGSVEEAATIDVVSADPGQVVGRLDADGNGVWMRNAKSQFFGSDLSLAADRVGVDENGDYYIIGVGLTGAGDIGGFTIPSENHLHIVRYNSSGTVVYAKFVTAGTSLAIPHAITVYGADVYNVVGSMVAQTVFDSFTMPDINGSPRNSPFSAQVGDITVPVLASLASAEASPDRVRLRWYVSGLEGVARVERRRGSDEWVVLGEAVRGGTDDLSYEDLDVVPGERLTYRLQWSEGGQELRSEPVEITVPRAVSRIALTAAPNPTEGSFDARIEVPAPGEGTLTMHDLQGRAVLERQVRSEGAGRLVVRLATSELPAGLYWLMLRHGGEVARTRVSVVR